MVVKAQRNGCALLLVVDRPDTHNAINGEVVAGLCKGIEEATRDESVHAVVLASTGETFLSGGDLNELGSLPMNTIGAERVIRLGATMSAIERCPAVVIAAIDGDTYGGGCELALMCDLTVMAKSAHLQFVHAKMGLVPAWGGTTRLCERIGPAAAADLLLTARAVGADEAHRLGLATRVAADGEVMNTITQLTEQLGAISRAALANIKRSLAEVRSASRNDALTREQKVFRSAWGSPQHRAVFDRL